MYIHRAIINFEWIEMKTKAQKILSRIKAKWKIIAVVAVVLILGIGYYINSRAANVVELTLINPERGSITQSIELSGTIDAKERARLRFLAGGKLTYVGAKEGDAVKKWQTLATIDQATLQKQLEQNLNNYSKERWDWEQTQDNINSDYNNQSDADRRTIDKEQFDLNNSVLTVEIQDIAIKNTRLTAPFDGILTTSPAAIAGMQLLPSDFFEVINPSTVVFRAYVEEEDVTKIKEGQSAVISLDAFGDETTESSVNYISYTAIQSSQGTVFIVEFPLGASAENMPFRIGMNGDARVILAQKDNVLSVPIISTIQRENITYVQVQNAAGEIEEREIETGIESDENIEVISGLSQSDLVVLPE